MNANPDIASAWKGRILYQVTAEVTDKPEITKRAIEEGMIEIAKTWQEPREFEIILEVGVGIALPKNKKYNVKVKIAEFELKTKEVAFAE